MARAAKKKAAPKQHAAKYEEIVQTLFTFDELIAMSLGKKAEKKELPKKV
jgi:hypothetical protein